MYGAVVASASLNMTDYDNRTMNRLFKWTSQGRALTA